MLLTLELILIMVVVAAYVSYGSYGSYGSYKERSIINYQNDKIAKIWMLKFWNFPWKKSRQNERSSAVCSLNVNTVFQDFFGQVKLVF